MAEANAPQMHGGSSRWTKHQGHARTTEPCIRHMLLLLQAATALSRPFLGLACTRGTLTGRTSIELDDRARFEFERTGATASRTDARAPRSGACPMDPAVGFELTSSPRTFKRETIEHQPQGKTSGCLAAVWKLTQTQVPRTGLPGQRMVKVATLNQSPLFIRAPLRVVASLICRSSAQRTQKTQSRWWSLKRPESWPGGSYAAICGEDHIYFLCRL